MHPERLADLSALLERAARESQAAVGVLSDSIGREVVRVGNAAPLPALALESLTPENLRRVALALEDEPEHEPAPGQTGGALILHARAASTVVTLVAPPGVPAQAFREGAQAGIDRILAYLEAVRRDRRTRFLAHRLLTRVVDQNHPMRLEIRSMLERTCDQILDMQEGLAAGIDLTDQVRQLIETVDELVAWPKGKESFQYNIENLQDSLRDLRPGDLTEDRLAAITAGLEVTIESWVLP
jgi:hypothetical protein